jgi:hypothetical protein
VTIDGSAFERSGIDGITIASDRFATAGHFLLDGSRTHVIRYFGRDVDVTVANCVSCLGRSSFSNCGDLETLAFAAPAALSRIEPNALCGCALLRSICVPASVCEICDFAFSDEGQAPNACKRLERVTFQSQSRLSRIGSGAFRGCSALKSMVFPASVASVGVSCFSGCVSLAGVAFEAGARLQRVEEWCFANCWMLRSVALPAAVEVLDKGCFYRCGELAAVRFEPHSRLQRIETSVFAGCMALKAVCVPPGVRVLCEGCYSTDRQNPSAWKAKGNIRLIVQYDAV